jgi:hypothetical protein
MRGGSGEGIILMLVIFVVWACFNWRKVRDIYAIYFHRSPPQD